MIVMQYANDGDLLSYLNQNINKLTWKMKLQLLRDIAQSLWTMHNNRLVHCDLHGGNVILHNKYSDASHDKYRDAISQKKYRATEILSQSFICDLGLSRSAVSESKSNIQGVLPFIAPEVFSTRKFTMASDIYAFGIIMYLVATGEPPFRDRPFDQDLVCDILSGLRPTMPDSAPDEYKKLAEKCCDVDPNKRPETAWTIYGEMTEWLKPDANSIWNTDTVYYNDMKPLSRAEKENKYSSKLLPKVDSVAGMKVIGLYIWCITALICSQTLLLTHFIIYIF
jgi:serine/threonine protein kinase